MMVAECAEGSNLLAVDEDLVSVVGIVGHP